MTTRRRKIVRSVARRRVKPRKSQNAKRTHKRKSRNIVMRGGAHGDISLYSLPKISKPECIILKKVRIGFRDDLYLFFHKDITSDKILTIVRLAMGLDDSFTSEFVPKYTDNTNYDELNDLFIKLSGIMSYSTIESGYLHRDKNSKYNEVVTLKKHKITLQSSAPEIKKWDVVISKLGFSENKSFQDTGYSDETVISRYLAEGGYGFIKSSIDRQVQQVQSDCKTKINKTGVIHIHYKENIRDAEKKIGKWPGVIERLAKINKSITKDDGLPITKEENSKEIRNHLDSLKNAREQYSAYDYDSNVYELRKILNAIKDSEQYQALSQECKDLYETEYPKYKTIDEIVSQVYS
jgi:hypothetical protein